MQQGFVEEAFKQQTSAELQFTVSNDAKYRNDAYGVLAVVKYGVRSSHDDPIRYELRAFKSEDDFKLFVQKKAPYDAADVKNYKEIPLVFRGEFIADKRYQFNDPLTGKVAGSTYYTAVATKSIDSNTRETTVTNRVTINNCVDFEGKENGGTMAIYYEDYKRGEGLAKQSAILCEWDGDLYTSVEHSSVFSGPAALTKLTQGSDFGLITYDANGNRTNSNSKADPITLM